MLENKGYRYLLVGIWNSIFGLSAFYIFSHIFGREGHQAALLCSYILAILQTHFTQRNLVWRSNGEYLPELARFSSSYALQYAINAVLLFVSVEQLKFSVIFSQILFVFFFTVIFYFVNQNSVFKLQGAKDAR
jgi:putative flippase GtrA